MDLRVQSFRHVRHAYHALAKRDAARARRALSSHLAQFVGAGDLVFDIGANVGNYTDVLLTLGARVVAIEPNPLLAATLRRRYPVAVEEAAVGREQAVLDLHLARNAELSTLSTRWLAHAPDDSLWSGEVVAVPVITVDDLVAKYGAPAFMKIDVEGFEADVLRGCSTWPPALSFEYQCPDLDVASECIAVLDGWEFNTVVRTTPRFDGGWVSSDELVRRLNAYREVRPRDWGDVYARRQLR